MNEHDYDVRLRAHCAIIRTLGPERKEVALMRNREQAETLAKAMQVEELTPPIAPGCGARYTVESRPGAVPPIQWRRP